MLELIERFLKYTGIKQDTFGRLTINDPQLLVKMRQGQTLTDESERTILSFMHRYEDAKE